MKIRPFGNIGVEICEIDITNLSLNQYQQLIEIFFDHLIVVIRNQPTEAIHMAKIVHMFGEIGNLNQCVWNEAGEAITPYKTLDPFTWTSQQGPFPVQRVTGKKVNNKDSGIFGTGVLDWHCNINGVSWFPGVALQGVSGVEGSHTSWMDTTKAYQDLPIDIKKRCEGAVAHFGYSPEVWAEGLPEWQFRFMTGNKKFEYRMPLVNVSEKGKKGLYFHFLNECTIPTDPELLNILKSHCLQSKYIHTLDWRPGDIHLSHQILTLHKREENDPKLLSERILNRYVFNFNKIYPNQKPLYLSQSTRPQIDSI